MKKQSDYLDYGIPCYKPISINTSDLIRRATKLKQTDILSERNKTANKELSKSLGMRTDSINLCSNINFYADKNSKYKYDLLEHQMFVNICELLIGKDLIDINTNDSIIIELVNHKIDELKFFINRLENGTVTNSEYNKFIKNNEYFLNHRYNKGFLNYLKYSVTFYQELINYYSLGCELPSLKIKDLFYPNNNGKVFEENKIKEATYLACKYMMEAKKALYNEQYYLVHHYLLFVKSYIRQYRKVPYMKKIEGQVKVEQVFPVNYDTIRVEYYKFINEYPEFNDPYLPREYFVEESQKENLSIINNIFNMRRLSAISDGKVPKREKRNVLSNSQLARLNNYREERLYQYLKNKPIAEIICCENLKNYIAFAYRNGVILADRFLDLNNLDQTHKDAIFVLNSLDLENQLTMTKKELNNLGLSIRHTSDWKEEVDYLANSNTSKELQSAVKKLLK